MLKIFILVLIIITILGVGFFLFSKNQMDPFLKKTVKTTSLESHSIKPIISNQWFSNINKSFPTEPLYAFPQSYKISESGLGFSLPKVDRKPETIFAIYNEDFSIGLESGMEKPNIEVVTDWGLTLSQISKKGNALKYSISQGVPFVVLHSGQEDVILTIPKGYKVYEKGESEVSSQLLANDFMLEVGENLYSFVLSGTPKIDLQEKTIIISPTERISVGVLDGRENYQLFVNSSSAEVTGTKFSFDINGEKISTSYKFFGGQQDPLIALLPHHSDMLSNQIKSYGEYVTLRGVMKLVKTSSFTNDVPFITPPSEFEKISDLPDQFSSDLRRDISLFISTAPPGSKNYFFGTWLGKGTSLLQLAVAYNDSQKGQLLNLLKDELQKSLTYFTYDNAKRSLIADMPEFGNENLNDHHFHYGYYIRAAAVLSSIDPSFKNGISPVIDKMVRDIATYDRAEDRYPFLRNFSVYESHSWADGYANAGDGNNQESSSEAVNAWYAVYLWGRETGDEQLEEIGLYLYNSEVVGARYYWWGESGAYQLPYKHKVATIVWGGKVDFATWFSPETNMKFGIEILPLTPASIYLRTIKNRDEIMSDYVNSGGKIEDSWGDMIVAFESFDDPQKAIRDIPKIKKMEDNNARSLLYQIVYQNR